MDSPASTCGFAFSDGSISDLDSQETSPMIVASNPEPKTSAPPECKGVPPFEPGDGDIQISVNGTSFESHKYLIKRFQGLKLLLDKNPLEISIQRGDISAEDFCEMLKVLYASIVTGPFAFTSHTLVSTLRVATIYEYHTLRDYCIQYLEMLELDAVKRIELAHEFDIPEWEKPAYQELGMRDEHITREEAKTIGLDAFVSIAEMREKEQRRRGKEIDATNGRQAGRVPVSSGEVLARCDAITNGPQEGTPHTGPLSGNTPEEDNTAACADHGTEVGLSLANIELGTIAWSSQHSYNVEIPSCKCHFTYHGDPRDRKCSMPSCVISAFKGVQTQQLAHANRISDLESSMKKLGDSFATRSAPTAAEVQPTALDLALEETPEQAQVVDRARTGRRPASSGWPFGTK
ncbi:hypothetical protein RSAG8_05782, partial [Rhizoctonia solani AG-8 WAC10335]